ncbi:MAG: GFA family protein [Candidatus Binatia bacterium]
MESGTIPGACLCGAVRFEIRLPTLFCAHCHCSMCRRAHGAVYVTWIAVLNERFTLLGGEDHLVRYHSSDHGTRSFCGTCGSSLFFTSTQHPEKIDIVLANLQGEIDRPPQFHVHFDNRVSWVHVDDGLPRLGGTTGLEPL